MTPLVASHPPQRVFLGITLRLASTVCWACMFALVKWIGLRGGSVFEIIFFRSLFGLVPLGLYIWRTTGFEVLKTQRPGGHLVRSSMTMLNMTCSMAAVRYLSLADSTALQFTAPLLVTGLSALILSEKVGRHRWGAVVVGFLGVLIMLRPTSGQMNVIGVTLSLLGAAATAGVMVAIRQLSKTERGPTIVFYGTLGPMLAGLLGAAFDWVTPDPHILTLLILAGLAGGVGQLLLTQSLRVAPLSVVAPFDYAQLVWATLLGLVLWGDLPRPLTLVGAAVVASSGIYILHRELRRARPS